MVLKVPVKHIDSNKHCNRDELVERKMINNINILILYMLVSTEFFQNNFFQKILSRISYACQTVWNHCLIRLICWAWSWSQLFAKIIPAANNCIQFAVENVFKFCGFCRKKRLDIYVLC